MKISIIVPVYNSAKYLRTCLDSLLSQTFKHIQIICINDGSTDNSADILHEYSLKYTNIKCITQENRGLAGARNTGLRNTTTEYVMFCDSDDSYHPQMCQKLYENITHYKSDIAACDPEIRYYADHHMKESDDNYYTIKYTGISDNIGEIINSIDVSSWDKIYKVEIIKKYNIYFPSGRLYEDAAFFWKYMSMIKSISFVNERLYIYNRRQGSIMNMTFSSNSKAIDHVIISKNILNFLLRNNKFYEFRDVFVKSFIAYTYFAIRYTPKWKYPLLFYHVNKIMFVLYLKGVKISENHDLNRFKPSSLITTVFKKILSKIRLQG